MTVLREEIGPDDHMPVFDIREPGIDVFFLGVRLRRGEEPIEIGRVRFVLPVVLERMNIGIAGVRGCFAGLERCRHAFKYRPSAPLLHRWRAGLIGSWSFAAGNPWMRLDVLCHRTIKEIG
jgi:hypothetical protein